MRSGATSLLLILRKTERRRWWVSFSLVAALGFLWALASPPTSTTDETAHAIRAAAVARGELIGRPLTSSQRAVFHARNGFGGYEGGSSVAPYRAVSVPEIYDRPNWGCFVLHVERSAACLEFSGPQRDASVVTPTPWYPPAYYAWVGLAAKPVSAGPRALYVMRLASVVLAAALLASAVASLSRVGDSPFVKLGLLVAVTPAALFLAASVNPNGLEITAGLALWVSGAVLATEARSPADGQLDRRLIVRVGIAAAVLVLARQLGPMWAALILLVLAAIGGMRGLRTLRSSRALWACGVGLVMCLIAALAWIVRVDVFDKDKYLGAPPNKSGGELAREAIGDGFFFFSEMVGMFGWDNVRAPTLTFLVWTAVVGGLCALAVALGRRREGIALLAVGSLAAVMLVVLGVLQRGHSEAQGRYVLPIAVGVPVLAGLALREPALRRARGTAVVLAGGALVAGHVLAYGQNLRRYTVGADGTVWFWTNPSWSPPVSPLLLVLGYFVAVIVWAAWLLVPTPTRKPEQQLETEAAEPDLVGARVC